MGRLGYVQIGLLCLLLGGIGGGTWLLMIQGRGERATAVKSETETPEAAPKAVAVKTVYPRRDKNFPMTVERPADVEAYYRANLEAQVAGEVKWVRVAPGSQVEKDQLLVRIHVPDKWAQVSEKKNVVAQREREHELMREKKSAADEAVKTALANVELKRRARAASQGRDAALREVKFENLEGLLEKPIDRKDRAR